MIRIALIAAVLLGFARDAVAEPARPGARLKELVTVTHELVRIGDLVDNAGASAGVPVFRAPDLGQTGTVAVGRVLEALRRHELAEIDTGGIAEVVVTRLSRAITGKQIQDRIARALAGQPGFGDAASLLISTDRELRTLHVEAAATEDLAITRMSADARTGRFDIAFEMPGTTRRLRVTGTAVETAEIATLARPVARGDVVRASDVVMERRPKNELSNDAVIAEHAVGLAVKRAMRAGQPLRNADLMRPEVVQRNETVTIVYEVPGIVLTMRGKALESGAAGDLINVQNVQSNRTVQATVSGPGRVTITSAHPRLAAAVTPANPAPGRAQ
jgi:flagella basal body P-ring formation protein FlgA